MAAQLVERHGLGDADHDARVEDYLNDKLQNAADLASIDALLNGVKAQHKLLTQQVKSGHQISALRG